jgi:hypothetical protein
MRKSSKSIGKRSSTSTTVGGLLASAAAMLLPKAAKAVTIVETTDFPNDFSTRQDLAPGVDGVSGGVGPFDHSDYFVFTGLTPGASFNLDFSFTGGFDSSLNLEWRDEPAGNFLNNAFTTNPGDMASFSGFVPSTGRIAVDVLQFQLNEDPQAEGSYLLQLHVQGVPDSGGTMMLMGAAVAGLALAKKLTRRRKKA